MVLCILNPTSLIDSLPVPSLVASSLIDCILWVEVIKFDIVDFGFVFLLLVNHIYGSLSKPIPWRFPYFLF